MSKTGGSLGAQGRLLRGEAGRGVGTFGPAGQSVSSAATARGNRRCSRSSRASPSRPRAAPRSTAGSPACWTLRGAPASQSVPELILRPGSGPAEYPLRVNGATLRVGTQHLRSVQVCTAPRSIASSTRSWPSPRPVLSQGILREAQSKHRALPGCFAPVKAPRSIQRHALGACGWSSRWPWGVFRKTCLRWIDAL